MSPTKKLVISTTTAKLSFVQASIFMFFIMEPMLLFSIALAIAESSTSVTTSQLILLSWTFSPALVKRTWIGSDFPPTIPLPISLVSVVVEPMSISLPNILSGISK